MVGPRSPPGAAGEGKGPRLLDQGAAPPLEELVEGLIFVVVFLNLSLQGLSLPWLCRRLERT